MTLAETWQVIYEDPAEVSDALFIKKKTLKPRQEVVSIDLPSKVIHRISRKIAKKNDLVSSM